MRPPRQVVTWLGPMLAAGRYRTGSARVAPEAGRYSGKAVDPPESNLISALLEFPSERPPSLSGGLGAGDFPVSLFLHAFPAQNPFRDSGLSPRPPVLHRWDRIRARSAQVSPRTPRIISPRAAARPARPRHGRTQGQRAVRRRAAKGLPSSPSWPSTSPPTPWRPDGNHSGSCAQIPHVQKADSRESRAQICQGYASPR